MQDCIVCCELTAKDFQGFSRRFKAGYGDDDIRHEASSASGLHRFSQARTE